MATNQYTSEPRRESRVIGTPLPERCFICDFRSAKANSRYSLVETRDGKSVIVCLTCRTRFEGAAEQVEQFGKRFRFVEKSEIPHPDSLSINEQNTGFRPYRPFKQIYKLLLLASERQISRQKEVNWMVEEMTTKILRLPDRVARILLKTFAVAGDSAALEDDQALMQIRDLLEEIDPEIFQRKQRKRKRPSKA